MGDERKTVSFHEYFLGKGGWLFMREVTTGYRDACKLTDKRFKAWVVFLFRCTPKNISTKLFPPSISRMKLDNNSD